MSYNLEINKPNGKSTQTYYFKHPWEPKHAIGVQHKKRFEFASRNGIAGVESLCEYRGNEYCGRFVISGKPRAVDALKLEISEWLKECQRMHYDYKLF
jgi:hypothetical protein